jgi:hypothetical protein
MSYLAFKEKMNSLKTDQFERHAFFERAQVYAVASFWIVFTAFLLWHGHEIEKREKAALRSPSIPEAVSVSQDEIPMPTARISKHK